MKLIKLLFALVVLLVVALFVAGYFADNIAKAGIETGGSLALGVDTTVAKARVGFLDQTFGLEGLQVANPSGFGNDPFLSLGSGKVAVAASSLLSDKVVVPEITLSSIRLSLEQGTRGSNYGTILDNLKRFQGAEKVVGSPEAEDVADAKRFVIETLTLEDVAVSVVAVPELRLAPVTVPLGTIQLKDIGSESDEGVVLAELAGIIVEAILERASSSGQLPSLIQGTLNAQLAQLDGLKDAGLRAVEGLLQGQGGKAVDDARKALDEGLKGMGLGR